MSDQSSQPRVYNTLSRKQESFKPIRDGRINLFVCGPTVYDLSHIGHAKAYGALRSTVLQGHEGSESRQHQLVRKSFRSYTRDHWSNSRTDRERTRLSSGEWGRLL